MLNLNSLNEKQREAVMHGEGPLLVLAGPGSGKTYTITQRIFYLIEKKCVEPEKILVITFTKEAALSMQSRFRQASKQILSVNFGTFHSVFYHILKESKILSSGQILTEAEKRKLIIPILKKYIRKEEMQYKQDLSEDATIILSAISYYKNTREKEGAIKLLPEEWRERFEVIFGDYERERRLKKAIDFDDMLYECYLLLKRDAKARSYWQNRFLHILMDEFQDINPIQYEIIRLLAGKERNLFAVGDDDQSIYGFRGAKPGCLKRFVEEYSAKQVCLNLNYRSRKEIIEASLTVINENKNRFRKELKAAPKREDYDTKAVIQLHAFPEREQQYAYLVERLREKGKNETVGVLFRTNAYMQGLAARLSREGISYTMKEKVRNIYEHFVVKDIMAYLAVAYGKASRAQFLQVMNKPGRHIGREAVGEGIPDWKKLVGYYRKEGLNTYHIMVIQRIEQWEKQMQCVKGLSPYAAVQYIRRAVGYEKYLREKAVNRELWQEWEELLDWLGTDASNYKTVEEWIYAQNLYGKQLEGKQDTKETGISLMTVHGSKGLEFDKVYIPDCNEKVFPHGTMPDEETREEERRIFYVGMTRAQKSLELLYLTGTKERPKLPSVFLDKLLKNYSSTSSSNSQLSKYSSKASATRSYSSSSSMKSSSGSSLGSSGFSL